MNTLLAEKCRKARKTYYCDMCAALIKSGDLHHVATYANDGRVRDWRTCRACDTDSITARVYDWADNDEGVNADDAAEWAKEVMGWRTFGYSNRRWASLPAKAPERFAARAWMARAAGGEGE